MAPLNPDDIFLISEGKIDGLKKILINQVDLEIRRDLNNSS